MPKPFDNEVFYKKTVWSDEELELQIELLNTAHLHLIKLGDRYALVLDDLQRLWSDRMNMQRNRRDTQRSRNEK